MEAPDRPGPVAMTQFLKNFHIRGLLLFRARRTMIASRRSRRSHRTSPVLPQGAPMCTSPSSRRAGIVALALACLVSAAALQAQQQQQNQGTLIKIAERKERTSDTSATPV